MMMMVEVQGKADALKQEEKTVQKYTSELQLLWANLDQYDPLQLTCAGDIEFGRAWLQRKKVTHFLKGLNPEFESRRTSICHHVALPTMEKAISTMVVEETRQRVMVGSKPTRSAYTIADDMEC